VGLDGPNELVLGHATEYTAHGFLTLQLGRDHLTENYRDADGAVLETLTLAGT